MGFHGDLLDFGEPAVRRIRRHLRAAASPPVDLDRMRAGMLRLLDADPALKSVYLLRSSLAAPAEPFTIRSLEVFLLWFAVFGRDEYPRIQRFTPDYLDFLWTPQANGLPRLAAFVLSMRQDVRGRLGEDPDALMGWFLCQGLVEHRLATLVPARVARELAAPITLAGEAACRTTRLDGLADAYAAALGDPTARDPDGASAPVGRRAAAKAAAALVPRFLAAPPSPVDDHGAPDLPGVSIVGFHRGTLGIGEDARSLFAALRRQGVPAELIDLCPPILETVPDVADYAPYEAEQPCFPVVVICAPPFETARIVAEWGPGALAGRHVVGYWPWELTRMQEAWRHVYDFVDEVWVSSRFLLDVFAGETAKPVSLVPMLVDAPAPAPVAIEEFGVRPDDFLFLGMFDFNSTIARKNPLGAIAAFRAAFPPEDGGVKFVIKTTHAAARPQDWALVEAAIGDDPRIIVVDGNFDRRELCGLIAAADAFVSLHRSEGFGRILAEAMALGTPVIATDWSGSRDYLDETTGYPVRCTLREVGPDEYPHAAGAWAEPDLDDAARIMAELRRNPAAAQRRVAAARQLVEEVYGLDAVAAGVRAMLATISTRI